MGQGGNLRTIAKANLTQLRSSYDMMNLMMTVFGDGDEAEYNGF